MLPSQGASEGPDDKKILEYAVELFRQLGITKPEPDTVVWDDGMDPDLVVVRYGEIRLPRSMMGRLTPEDWRPLLAPAIIYNYLLLRNEFRDSELRLLLPLGLASIPVALGLLSIIHLAKGAYLTDLLVTLNVLLIVYFSSVILLYVKRRWRSLPYTADRRAADIIGKDVLLAALAKYGETITATGYPLKRLHLGPTVNQRIEYLRKDGQDQ